MHVLRKSTQECTCETVASFLHLHNQELHLILICYFTARFGQHKHPAKHALSARLGSWLLRSDAHIQQSKHLSPFLIAEYVKFFKPLSTRAHFQPSGHLCCPPPNFPTYSWNTGLSCGDPVIAGCKIKIYSLRLFALFIFLIVNLTLVLFTQSCPSLPHSIVLWTQIIWEPIRKTTPRHK